MPGDPIPNNHLTKSETSFVIPYQWRDGLARQRLPMDYALYQTMDAIDANQVTVLQAETGVGKTTRIGQAYIDSHPDAHVFLTQTKRPAVVMNGERIAEEMGGKPGEKVGWRLKGEPPQLSDETQLQLMIDQSLVNKIRREGKLPDGLLIIDEAHDRTVQLDVLLALIKLYLPQSPNTKLLITSATIDTQKFCNFFNVPEPIIVPNKNLHHVDVRPNRLYHGEHHTEGAIRAMIEDVIVPFKNGGLTVNQSPDQGSAKTVIEEGAVLMLLPGKEDISQAKRSIEIQVAELGIKDRIEIMECHSQMTTKEQLRVRTDVPKGVLRIVCATEIIRSSVTVPNTVGLVDSLQVKRYTMDENGVSHLRKVTISGAEADQGKGRPGRERPGFYIPVSFGDEYEIITNKNNPEYWPQPAILRQNLSSVILQIAAMNLNIRDLPMIDKPDDQRISVTMDRLKRLGILDSDEKKTDLGHKLVEFTVTPEKALTLFEAQKRGVVPETAIAIAVLENEGIMFVPPKNSDTVEVDEHTFLKLVRRFGREKSWDSLLRRVRDGMGTNESDTSILTNLPEWAEKTRNRKYKLYCKSDKFPSFSGAKAIPGLVWEDFADGTNSDFYAAVQAYRAFRAEKQKLHDEYSLQRRDKSRKDWVDSNLSHWCKDHFLVFRKLQFIENTIRDLVDTMEHAQLDVADEIDVERDFNSDDLTKSLLTGLVDSVSQHDENNQFHGPKADSIILSDVSACRTKPKFALTENVRKVHEVGKYQRDLHFTDMAAPIESDWLEEANSNMITRRQDSDGNFYYDPYSDKVVGSVGVYFGDLRIKTEEGEAIGETAVPVFAKALASEQVTADFIIANKETAKTIDDYWVRSRGKIGKKIDKDTLAEWYKDRIGTICSKRELVAAINSGRVNLNLSVDDFITTAQKDQVRRESPDSIVINDQPFQVSYAYNPDSYYSFAARITVTPDFVNSLSEIPKLPSGENVTLIVFDPKENRQIAIGSFLPHVISQIATEAELRRNLAESRSRDFYPRFDPYRYAPTPQRSSSIDPEKRLRIDDYEDVRQMSIDDLGAVLKEKRNSDRGQWNLAAAALLERGLEGIESLFEARITKDEIEGIDKALDKATKEAESNGRNQTEQFRNVQTARRGLEMYSLIHEAVNSQIVKEYIGKSAEYSRLFREGLYQRLAEMFRNNYPFIPSQEKLEALIEETLEEITR